MRLPNNIDVFSRGAGIASSGSLLSLLGTLYTGGTTHNTLWPVSDAQSMASGVVRPRSVGRPGPNWMSGYLDYAAKNHHRALADRMSPSTALELLGEGKPYPDRLRDHLLHPSPAYDAGADVVRMHTLGPFGNPVTLAHELGHAEARNSSRLLRALMRMRAPIGIAGMAAPALAAFGPEGTPTAAAAGALGGLSALSTLALELDANRRASRALGHLPTLERLGFGADDLARVRRYLWRPFKATYLPAMAAVAAAPLLVSYLRREKENGA